MCPPQLQPKVYVAATSGTSLRSLQAARQATLPKHLQHATPCKAPGDSSNRFTVLQDVPDGTAGADTVISPTPLTR